MYKHKNLGNKRRERNDAGGEGNVPKKRRKVRGSRKPMDPEMARREEERLQKLVLGDGSEILRDESNMPSCSYTPAIDDSGVEEDNCESSPQMSDTLASPERQPAWVDEEDENVCVTEAMEAQGRSVPHVLPGGKSSDPYSKILKHKFEYSLGTPAWARLDHRNTKKSSSDDDEDSDSELLRRCGNMLSKQSSSLRKGVIDVTWMRDLNHETKTEGHLIKVVQFHKSATVALVAGKSGVASLFQVEGKENTKLKSVLFERYPITCGHFMPGGEQFMVKSKFKQFFYKYDMMAQQSFKTWSSKGANIIGGEKFKFSPDGRLIAVCGQHGSIHLLTVSGMEYLATLKMNNDVRAIEFSDNGYQLYSHGEGGEVYIWDIGTRRCSGRFVDDGCLMGTSLAVSPGNRFLACGSQSGVVNIYETEGLLSPGRHAPTPAKILQNLTTRVRSLQFNPAAEILAMTAENTVKLVHFPSLTVFQNFPVTHKFPYTPDCVDFSPGSGFLAIACNRSCAALFRLKHYGNY